MRVVVAVAAALIVSGCAQQPAATVNLQNLPQSAPVADCGVDYREHGQATEHPIEMDQKLEATLLEQAGAQNIQRPLCWYETSGGEIFARSSSVCGSAIEYHFRKDGSAWGLAKAIVLSCQQTPE